MVLLRLKAQKIMAGSESDPLDGEVHVDEFSTGGHKKRNQGRSLDGKKHTVLFVQIVKDKKEKERSEKLMLNRLITLTHRL